MKKFVVLLAIALFSLTACARDDGPGLRFEPLPYGVGALEPHIDAQTMEIHYGRHHRGYFDNLVKAVAGTALAGKSLEEILDRASQRPAAVRNNAGGHYNHTLFWKGMSPNGGGAPEGPLAEKIAATFGSVAKFQEAFTQAALTLFGSGWVWLCVEDDGALFICATPNQDNPLMDTAERRGTPILALDVWEHAYYLKYQNRRAAYIEAFWHVVDWPALSARYEAARKPPTPA